MRCIDSRSPRGRAASWCARSSRSCAWTRLAARNPPPRQPVPGRPSRRASPQPAPPLATGGTLTAGDLKLDVAAHRITVHEREVELTATEFKLLKTLMERAGRVQSRDHLLQAVWQAQPDIQTRTVDMHVQRLRA